MVSILFIFVGVGVLVLVGIAIALSRRNGVEVVSLRPPAPGSPGLQSPEELVRAGRKIEAIKRYREIHGVGLKEAKDAVEAFEHNGGNVMALPAKSVLREVHDSEIEAQIRSGHLIDAIKLYREKNGVGLKEAKDAVEAWRDRMRAS